MNLDKRVVAAIKETVKELGEQPGLAEKIIALLDSLAGGNARLDERDSADRQLELLYQNVSGGPEDERAGE